MPIGEKIKSLVHRGPSDKNLNGNTTTSTPAATTTTTAAPVARTYELPAETTTTTATTTSSHLAGKSYELPAEEFVAPVNTQTSLNSGLYNDSTYIQGVNRSSVRAEPTLIETIQKDVVVHERIHPVEKEEIQPIIYREREQLDVKQVTQMMHETEIQPTIIQQRELAPQVREAVVERSGPIAENIILPTTQRDATLRTQQVHAPIIEETIKKTVIEEVQPVLQRDVIVPTIIQNTQPIYEKIVEAPTVYRETRQVQELGTREFVAPVPVPAPVFVEREVIPATLQVVPITTTTTVETYDHKLNPAETRDFVNNRGLPLR